MVIDYNVVKNKWAIEKTEHDNLYSRNSCSRTGTSIDERSQILSQTVYYPRVIYRQLPK